MIDMSIETAVFSGMGLIVLWGLVMLWIAANSAHKSRSVNASENQSRS
jgi:hypothetical protein